MLQQRASAALRAALEALRARPRTATLLAATGAALLLAATALALRRPAPPLTHDDVPPARTLLGDASVAIRVRGLRAAAALLQATVLPAPRPSAVELPSGPRRAPVRLLIYLPPGVESVDAAATEALPAFVSAHGGGFIAGGPGDDDDFCRFLAAAARVVVISVDYALAPETPPPAAVLDIARAAGWAASALHAPRIGLGGFSAGASLALAAAVHLAATGAPVRAAIAVAFFPPVDLSERSLHTFVERSPYKKELYYEAYLRDTPPSMLRSPLVSPAYAAPEHFPPRTVLLSGSLIEPNLRDIAALAVRLEAHAAGSVRYVDFAHVPHGWTHLPAFVLRRLGAQRAAGGPGTGLDAKNEAFDLVAKEVRNALVGLDGALPVS